MGHLLDRLGLLQVLILIIFTTLTKADDVQSQCIAGTYMKSSYPDEGHRCVADCGPGQYGDDSTRSCQLCDSPCLTCAGTADNCTSCSEPRFLLRNRCVMDCGNMYSRGPARSRLRLRGGTNAFEGRVEILHEGVWGSICNDKWDIRDAQVVCGELQLGSAVDALSVSDDFESASPRMPIHLDDLECSGTESKLEFCPHLEWGRHNCAHDEDAAVRCSGPDVSRLCVASCGDGYYRVSGTNRCELCSSECRTCTDRPDHCLACEAPRFLLNDRCVLNCGSEGHGNTQGRTCEACHENCNNCFDGPTNSKCSSCKDHLYLDGDICVESCDPQLSKNLAIRLAGGMTAYEGRVEVYIDGEWGTVCDDDWDINDAQVVCRELGYGSAMAAVSAPAYGAGTGPVVMNHVQCEGTEAELVHCQQSQWRDNQCRHTEDAGVRCEGEMRTATNWGALVSTLTHPGATGRCVDACGLGYYLPSTSDYDCAACSSECLSCEITADQCTSCKASKFLKGSRCVDSCGPTEYGNTASNRCELCDVSVCETCQNGTRNDKCESCHDGKVLKGSSCVQSCGPDMYSQAGVCQQECDHGYYGNPASYICQSCSEQCLTCGFNQEFSIVCTTCRAPKILNNGQCIDSCPSSMLLAPTDQSKVPGSDQIRLVGGRDQLEGRLEVFHDGQWGSVCSDNWSMSSATVACTQLNLGRAESVLLVRSGSQIEPGQGTIWLDNVSCRGTESSLDECRHNSWGQNNCNHWKDVALRCSGPGIRECVTTCPQGYFADAQAGRCSPCQQGCMRCVNQPTYSCLQCQPGTLLHDDQCVEECSSGYHPDGSNSTCIPCNSLCATCATQPDYCTSCNGELILEGHTCVPQCDGYKLVLTDKIRLVGGASPMEGRVEVLHEGQFGTVCDDQWGLEEANVVCAQLGLGRAVRATEEATHGEGTGAIVLDNVNCNGDETSLMECDHSGVGVHNCQHDEDAGVVCTGPVTSNTCIQRSDCSDGFFVAADGVTCGKCSFSCATCADTADNCISCPDDRYLNQDHECVETCPGGYYGDSDRNCQPCSGDCQGCIDSADHCTSCASPLFLQAGACVSACDSSMFVKKGPSDIRLVDGSNSFAGRVEVMFNGAWGTVCDDEFDTNDANVICRQLQMGYAIEAFSHAHFGEGTGDIVLDELRCNGDEESLAACAGNRLGSDTVDCGHEEDAGVQCSGPGSALHCLEDCGQGYFATEDRVCEHCSSLCHTCQDSSSNCLSCLEPMFLLGNTCVEACPAGQYGNAAGRLCAACADECQECFDGETNNVCRSCKEGYYLDGPSCVSQCRQAAILESVLPREASSPVIRLAGGSETEGRVEIFYQDKWGTVCADEWDLIDGEVVCQQLGLGHVVNVMTSYAYGSVAPETPIWLDSVDCKGWEFALSQCSHEGWNAGRCESAITMSNGDAAIRCSGSATARPPKNICRAVMDTPCSLDTCSADVTCVDLEGQRSVCMECPEGQIGTGTQCTMVASAPPEFERAPEDRNPSIGQPASLNCRAKDGSAPRVTAQNWLKDGQPIPQVELDGGRILALNFGSLYIKATRRGDTGNYTCVIRNTQGVNTASAVLTVEESPQIMQKMDATVAVGDSATLGCNVVGLPVSTLSWRYRGEQLTGERFSSYANNGTLVINNVSSLDGGEYQCFAENKKGTAHTTVTLTVYEPPEFTVKPNDIYNVNNGETLSIQCQAQGKPTPRILWKKDGDELPHIANRFTVMPTGDLRLANVDTSDMGVYSCIAVNSVQSSSLSTQLLVNGPPVFKTIPSNYTLSTGETIVLQCEVMGTHNPVVTWEKDGDAVQSGDHYNLGKDGLQIKSVTQADTGEYTCIGSNAEGSVKSSAYVTVSAPVFGNQQVQPVGIMWLFIVVIIILLLIIVVIVGVVLRRRHKQQALFNHSRLNRSPKKSALGVVFTERTNGSSYVEIKKQKAKEEREMQEGIIEDVDIV